MTRAVTRRNGSDFIEHAIALDHFTEYSVAPALHVFTGVVQKIVILNVDKKLSSSAVGIHGARHCNSAVVIG